MNLLAHVTILAASLAVACGGHSMKSNGAAATSPGPAADSAAYGADSAGAAESSGAAMAASGVAAGEWDDNANYREFEKLLADRQGVGFHQVDIRDRQFIVVRDSAGKGVPSCRLEITDPAGKVARLTTLSSGRAVLFPRAEQLVSRDVVIDASCGQVAVREQVSLVDGEGVIELTLDSRRVLPARPVVDIAFVLDSTGSMSEEIASVKATIHAVSSQLDSLGADIRVGLVEFKDRTDELETRVYPLTGDLQRFSADLDRISARGGGDMPESVNAGLAVAVRQLAWNPAASARLAFLVGDAPPHLDYAGDVSYAVSMREAAGKGIQIHTIAASGMDLLGQIVWRQIAMYTGGTNMFVLRGGAGPQSTGGGDPVSSCGGTQQSYTSGNLDQLVLGKIRIALKALDADPMQIAGLGQDERAKPCSERVLATD